MIERWPDRMNGWRLLADETKNPVKSSFPQAGYLRVAPLSLPVRVHTWDNPGTNASHLTEEI